MKKTLLFASIFAAGSLMAQDAFTDANEVANGTYSYFVCDSMANNFESVVGTGVTWDYSDLAKYDGATKALIVDDASTAPNGSDFPSADVSSWIEELTNDYWSSDNARRYRHGIVVSMDMVGDVVAKFDAATTVFDYPFNLNDESTATLSGDADTQMGQMPFTGDHKAIYDGFGTLKIGDQTIDNVSRIQYIDNLTIDTGFLGDIEVELKQFEYYDLANSTEPIFIYYSINSAMASFNVVMSSIEPTEVIIDDVATTNIDAIDFTVSPNPVKDQLTLGGDFANADIQIVNQAGQVVYNGVASNGSVISTASFEAGVYVVKASVNNQVITKKVVKF